MTLTRTIRRREKRKRAKLRAATPQPRGVAFVSAPWLIKYHIANLKSSVRAAKYFSREYK